MEVLAALTVPDALQLAYSVLSFAWKQYGAVEERKSQCKLLIERSQDLLIEVAEQSNRGTLHPTGMDNLRFLESACMAVKAAIVSVAGKNFAWRLLHQDHISETLSQAETAVVHACTKFNIGAHFDGQRLQYELAAARERDHSDLVLHLRGLAESDQKILEALQYDGRELLRIQELVIALTKHVQNLGATTAEYDKPAVTFVRTATSALYRLSQTQSIDIPRWSVTSLEVSFDINDESSCIGRGGFGRIYRGEWHGQVVAVKQMHPEDARVLDRQKLKDVRREISIWSSLTHPHVLPFYCACLEASQPFMVTKLCPHGNTLEFLRRFPKADRICMLHEISLGMNYLHIKNIVHADLKAANIMIGDDGKALITDFGLSLLQDQVSSKSGITHISLMPTFDGSLRWMAPERLNGNVPDKPADVYSFAITAWELYTGEVPFTNVPDQVIVHRVADKEARPERPPSMESDPLWDLVKHCWNQDPDSRPVFEALHFRLKPLTTQSNASLVVSGLSRRAPSTPPPLKVLSTGLGSPTTPHPVSQALSSPFLPPLETLSLGISERNIRSNSPANEVRDLHSRLNTPGLGPEKITIISALELLSRSEDGRAAICSEPDLFFQFLRLLSHGSSDAKEQTTVCLVNLAWEDRGKRAIIACPDLFPPIIKLLWHGSSGAKENAARCLSRLAISNEAQKLLLIQPGILPALMNLLPQWTSPKEKEQSTKCLVCLSCSAEGQRALIAQSDLVSALVKLLSYGSSDAKQNAARCLANLATNNDSQVVLLAQPGIISALGGLLAPGMSVYETEQAVRCLQYLAYSSEGQSALMAEPTVLSKFSRLLSHDSATVQKHTAACCRNLCQSLIGTNAIFTQRGLPYNLKALLFSAPADTKEYAVAAFVRMIYHCLNPAVPLDSLPVRHDRQCFLLALEELLYHTSAQNLSAACLRRLCSDGGQPAARWLEDIGDRPSLLLALANLTLKGSDGQNEAAHCLALVSRRVNRKIEESFLSQPELLSALANTLSSGSPESRKFIAECLTHLTTSGTGAQIIRQHAGIVSALRDLKSNQLTHADIKGQADLCLQNLNLDIGSRRLSRLPRWTNGRFLF